MRRNIRAALRRQDAFNASRRGVRASLVAGGSDPYFANVAYLADFEGTNGDTTYTDQSSNAKAMQFNGTNKIDSAWSKFGTTSLRIMNSQANRITPAIDAYRINDDRDYTVEFDVRWNSTPSSQDGLVGLWGGTAATQQWIISYYLGQIAISSYSTTNSTITTFLVAQSIVVGQEYHIAAVLSNSGAVRQWEVFVDGVSIGTDTAIDGVLHKDVSTASSYLEVGGYNTTVVPFDGWIDNLRLTNGVARYTANFTPPTAAHPTA
jgi:hypothetical protein